MVRFHPFRRRRHLVVKRLDYTNPYYDHHPKHRWRGLGIIVAVLFGVAVLYVLFWSPVFQVATITVEGTKTINPQSVVDDAVRWLSDHQRYVLFPQSNTFIVNTGRFQSELMHRIEERNALDVLTVEKRFRGLTITIEETLPEFVWASGKHYYYLDASGEITSEESDITTIDVTYPVLDDINQVDVSVGNRIVSEDLTRMLGQVFQEWEGDFSDTPLLYAEMPELLCSQRRIITVEDEEKAVHDEETNTNENTNSALEEMNENTNNTNGEEPTDETPMKTIVVEPNCPKPLPAFELHLVTQDGWKIYISTKQPVQDQLDTARRIIKEKFPDGTDGLGYIDVRFPGRVYYQ